MTGNIQIGGAEFVVSANTADIDAGLRRAEAASRQSSAKINRELASIKRSGTGAGKALRDDFAGGLKSAAAGAVGFGAVVGVLSKVGQATQDAAQAAFALKTTYGTAAASMTAATARLATELNTTNTSTQRAAVTFGTLQKNYALSTAQIENLVKISADLAAVQGIDLNDAATRVQSAIRGEGEAAEYLGLTLNSNAVKAMGAMTNEQRKNFETLDQNTKAQIIYNELVRQSGYAQGAAAKRAADAAGAYDKLGKSLTDLAIAAGKSQAGNSVAGLLTTAAESATNLLKITDLLGERQARYNTLLARQKELTGTANVAPGSVDPRRSASDFEASVQAALPEAYAEERQKALVDAFSAAELDQATALVNQRNATLERMKAADKKAFDSGLVLAKKAAEQRQTAVTTLLEDEQKAYADTSKAAITEAEKGRDAAIKAADERRTAALAALDAEVLAVRDARTSEDRGIRAAQTAEDRARAAGQEQTLRALKAEADTREQDNRAARKAIEDERDTRLDALATATTAEKQRSTAALRGLAQEQQAEQTASETALRALDERQAAEKRRSTAALANLDREEKAALAPLQAQLDALDATDRARQNAATDASLQERLTRAQSDAARASLIGDPRAAQAALRQVADAQAAIQEEQRRRDEDAQRAAIQTRMSGVGTEYDAKRAAEASRTEQATAALAAEKTREQERTAAALAGIETRKAAEQAASQATLAGLQAEQDAARGVADTQLAALADQRGAEQRAQAERLQEVQDLYEAETTAIADARTLAAQTLEDQRLAEDRAFDARKKAVQATYDDERTAVANTATATIDALKDQADEAEASFDRRKKAADAAFQSEQDWLDALGKSADDVGKKLALLTSKTANGPSLISVLDQADQAELAPRKGANLPRRAAGGPVRPEDWYIVGEQGPELFRPSRAGMIVPNQDDQTRAALRQREQLATLAPGSLTAQTLRARDAAGVAQVRKATESASKFRQAFAAPPAPPPMPEVAAKAPPIDWSQVAMTPSRSVGAGANVVPDLYGSKAAQAAWWALRKARDDAASGGAYDPGTLKTPAEQMALADEDRQARRPRGLPPTIPALPIDPAALDFTSSIYDRAVYGAQASGGTVNVNMGGVTVTNEADEQRLANTVAERLSASWDHARRQGTRSSVLVGQ